MACAKPAGRTERHLNSPYTILVLRGAQMRRLVVSPKRLRELLLACVTLVLVCGLVLDEYVEEQRRRVEEVTANSHAQKEKLSVLRDRAAEIEKVLTRWRGVRERIHASLPERKRTSG